MDLGDRKTGTSFYETFSDLIFATMAVFVLLMIVFIVQITTVKDLDVLEEEVSNEKAKLEKKKEELKVEQKKLSNLKKSEKSLQQYDLELVIAVDTTGSMQRELDQLTSTIGLIAKVLPRIATTVKIGVVAYRKDQNENLTIQRFPLTTIRDRKKDRGQSYKKLYNFVRYLKAKTGSAPVELAVDDALKMFTKADEFTGHQTFMLLGDVGPYEDRYRDQVVDARNQIQEDAMVDQIKIWTKGHLHRNLLILFSGEDEIVKTLKVQGESGPQYQKFIRSRTFFERLAKEAEQPEAYTVNSTEMIPSLLSAMLK